MKENYSYILVYKCPQLTAKYSYQTLKHKDHMQNLTTTNTKVMYISISLPLTKNK